MGVEDVNGGIIVSGGVGIAGAANIGGALATSTLKVGSTGSTINRIHTATSTNFNNAVVAGNASTSTTLSISGATTNSITCVAKVSADNPNFAVDGWVSVNGTVTATLYNRSATSQTFSGSVRVIVFG